MNESKTKQSVKCPECGLVDWTTDASCKRCGASLLDAFEKEPAASAEAEVQEKGSRIHQWDTFAFKRALLGAVIIEAFFIALFAITPAHTGSVNPHNPPPLSLCCLNIVYLPAAIIFPHKTFGYVPMVVFHTILVIYVLFVGYRLKRRSSGRFPSA